MCLLPLIGALAGCMAGYVLHDFYVDVHFHLTQASAFGEVLIRAWADGKEILLGAVIGSALSTSASFLLMRVNNS